MATFIGLARLRRRAIWTRPVTLSTVEDTIVCSKTQLGPDVARQPQRRRRWIDRAHNRRGRCFRQHRRHHRHQKSWLHA
jgi:hypothetical protein